MCRVNFEKLMLLSLMSLWTMTAWGQITNCPGAHVICTDSAIVFTPFGVGFDDFNNPNNDPGCLLTEENQSAWYYFAFNELMPPNSVIRFTIDPNGGSNEDYDFAIYGPYLSCDSLGEPIRCSFANILCTFCPQTGLGMGATDASEGAMNEDGFVLPMVVQPGEGYYLLLDNWYGSSSGFQLTWGGSAAPFLNCLADPDCSAIRIEAGNDLSFCDVPPSSLTLQGTASGHRATATFEWSAPNGAAAYLSDVTVLQPTLTLPPGFTGLIPYTLTVTDGDCTKSSVMEVQIGNVIGVNIIGTTQICAGDTTILSIGGNWSAIEWSTNSTNDSIIVTQEGDYSIEVTNGSGCVGRDTVTVSFYQVDSAISGGASLCTGDTLLLEAAPDMAEYEWSTSATDSIILVTVAGTYSLTVTDANGCTGQSSITVVDRPLPTPVIDGPAGLCSGETTTLSLNQEYAEYEWSDLSTADTLLVNAAGDFEVLVTDTFGCQGTATFSLVALPVPSVTITGDTDFCENGTTLLVATGGFQTYQWSNGSSGQSVTVDTADDHSVTATDSNGCTATATVQTTILPLPVLNLVTQDSFCAGTTFTLDAGPGFASYLWTPGNQPTQTITASAGGTYEVSVTDANGCGTSATVEMTENPLPLAAIGGATGYCADSTVTLIAPGDWANYTWTGGISNTDLIVSTPGTYAVTVTDHLGCSATTEITVTRWPNPVPVITGPAAICPGETVTLDATGPFFGYEWTGGSTDPTLTINEGGTYEVTVMNGVGCTGTVEFTVTEFVVDPPDIPAVLGLCPSDTIVVDPTGNYASYLWSDQSTLPTLTVMGIGFYGLTVTDENNCTSTAAFEVEGLLAPVVNLPMQSAYCVGESVNLDAGDGFVTYEWTGGQTTDTLTVSTPGTYTVTVTDANGCEGQASTVVEELTALEPVITGTPAFCVGDSTVLTVEGGFTTYLWSTDAETASIFVTQPGEYSVTVQDLSGCTGTVSITVSQWPETVMEITGATTFCADGETTLTATPGLSNYNWTSGNSTTNTLLVNTAGTYTVTAADANGCAVTASVDATVAALPTASAASGNDISCNTTQTTLSGSSDQPNPTYEWQGPGITNDNRNLANPVVNQPGQYILIVTTQPLGCASEPVTVTVNDLRFTPTVTVTANDALDCNTASVTVTGQASGANSFVYAWYDNAGNLLAGQTTTSLNVTTAGVYRFRATEPVSGCFAEATVAVLSNVVYPLANAGAAGQLDCNNETLTLNGSTGNGTNYTFNWTALQGNIVSGANTLTPVIDQAGTYVLNVLNNDNGCSSADTVSIANNNEAPVANAGADQSLSCLTDETTLDGTGSTTAPGMRYEWEDATGIVVAEGITANIGQPGTYTLVVTNTNNGCSDTDEVLVTLNEDIPQIAELELLDPPCFGDNNGVIDVVSVSGGTAPYTYTLNDGTPLSFGTFSNLTAGEYDLHIEDAEGCGMDTTLIINAGADLQVELGRDRTIKLGDGTTLEALLNIPPDQVTSIDWDNAEGGACPGCFEWQVAPWYTTTYAVFVQDENGCLAEDRVTVFVDKTRRVFIPNSFSPNNDGINDVFMIFADNDVANIRYFKILDRWGELVWMAENFQPNDPDYGWNGNFRGRELSMEVFVYLAEIEFIDGEILIYKGSVHLMR